MYQKMSLVKIASIFVATAAVSQMLVKDLAQQTVLAQSSGEISTTFPIPDSLPDGTTLKVDGSTSMRSTNEDLESRFEQEFPNVDVQFDGSRTDEAFEALIAGDIDILATGRPLTEAEKAQSVIEVPLKQREKLAIIVGPNNEFAGDLTFDQFARIFRGEISNWSEVGGADLPIRVVDRPDYSDTRRALSTYDVFEDSPFEIGATADPVAEDETDAVAAALGIDGIGYTVVSQAINRDDVRIIPMHQTLPDDPRYPYSQYRAFVYREEAGPAVLAFMGFATTEPGQEVFVVESARTATPEVTDPAAAGESAGAENSPEATGSPAPTDAAADASTVKSDIPPAPVATSEPETAAADRGGFPFWILPLLAIPILGVLLWWLLKSAGAISTPSGAAVSGGTTATALPPRIVLTPRDSRNAYAYWEIPQESLDEVKRQGGKTMMLRLYDITGHSKNAALPVPVAEFMCLESTPDLHLPIAMGDRSYCAEVGYLGPNGHWLPIVKSDPVRVRFRSDSDFPTTDVQQADGLTPTGAALGGAVLAGAAALGATASMGDKATLPGRMVLTPRSGDDVYAYWELPPNSLADAQRQGGETLVAQLYDITERSDALSEPTAQLECTETDKDAHFAVAANRDYIATLGYQTASGDWLPLAQSNSIRVSDQLATDAATGSFSGGAAVLGVAAAAALQAQPSTQRTTQTVKVHSRNNAVMFDQGQLHHIEHDVAVTHDLIPGIYILRLREGVFNYDADDDHPGEPFVMLWIHGGTVINQKTEVPVSSTWTTLNGYDDTLILDVREPTKLSAFFVDTYPDDNSGEVTLSVTRQ